MTTPLATSISTPANAGTATLVRPAHSDPESFNTLIGDLKEAKPAQDETPVEHTALPRQVVTKSEKSKVKSDKKDDAQPAIVATTQVASDDPLKRLLAFTLSFHADTAATEGAPDTETGESNQTGETPVKGAAKIALAAALDPGAAETKAASTPKSAPEAKSTSDGQLSFSARILQTSPRAAESTEPASKPAIASPKAEEAQTSQPTAEPKQEERHTVVTEKVTAPSATAFTETTTAAPQPPAPEAGTAAQQVAPADRVQLAESLPVESASRDFSVKIAGPDQAQATLRIRETAGEVRVSVHTPDQALSKVLRTELDSLNTRMESSGVKAQVWAPAQSAATSDSRSHADSQSGRSHDSQAQQSRWTSNDTDDDHQQRRSRWTEEMERQYAD